MTWRVPEELARSSWTEMKIIGVNRIKKGEQHFDLSEWKSLGSQHLSVVVFWWTVGKRKGNGLKITGADSVFKTLASLGGVDFILTET